MPHRYYGAYLQSVNRVSGSRFQMLVLPPYPRPPGAEYSALWDKKFVWWDRLQTMEKQRPQWTRHYERTNNTPEDRFAAFSTGDRWLVAHPIVAPVPGNMILRLLTDGGTPYPLIRLLERKAELKGIVIAGPTSVPKVVTQVPTA